MNHQQPHHELLPRRHLLGGATSGICAAALATLLDRELPSATPNARTTTNPRAKRVTYLCQSGAPSQMDLFDHKPVLQDRRSQELPDSIRKGQRLTGMTKDQDSFPLAPTAFQFARHRPQAPHLPLPRPPSPPHRRPRAPRQAHPRLACFSHEKVTSARIFNFGCSIHLPGCRPVGLNPSCAPATEHLYPGHPARIASCR